MTFNPTAELPDAGEYGQDVGGDHARRRARRVVRHFLADFPVLESRYPGVYPRLIVRAEGPFVWDAEGHRLLDVGGHLGACQVGHGRREIAERMARQAQELDFIALDSGHSHPKALELAEALTLIVPIDDPMFSFTSSGSESNELAFKIARAYHDRRGEPSRTVILSRDGSYHGSTIAGMAATGAPAFRAGYGPVAPGFQQVAQPSPGRCGYCEPESGCTLRCADALEEAVEELGRKQVAAVVAEPVAILQAVKVPHEDYWPRVQEICASNGILLILDEVVMALANNTPYGLAAGVWTRDVRRAHLVARALQAGTVWINMYRAMAPQSPFGGFKTSGIGRQNGLEGIDEYLQTKSVWVELSDEVQDPFVLKA